MSGADWIIVGAVFISALLAASQGFFYEVISLAGTVIGYLVASWQYHRVADCISPHVNARWVADFTGFVILFLAIVLLAGFVARLARWALREAGLSWFDRTLGALFGVLRGALIVSVILIVMTAFEPGSRLLANSELAPYFLIFGRAAIWLAPSDLRARFYAGLDLLHNARTENLPAEIPGVN
ncbi:MAG: CvpA family protein [Acidobacteria bacterium]|nr:CvpA family protein [Acidobacteriota bacterium]MBV8891418.1 CvpA family protein [Acidobacteriota bacterium]